MQFSWWEIAVAGLVGIAAWGLRWAFADFVLDRFGDIVSDRLQHRDREA